MKKFENVLFEFKHLNLTPEELGNILYSFIQEKYPNSEIKIIDVQKTYSSYYGYEYFIIFNNDGNVYKEVTSQALFNDIIRKEV